VALTVLLPRLELICFGPPTARVEGRDAPAEVLWPRHLALLVYLALSPNRTRTRSHLLGVFWPEKVEARARHALNEALLRLRHSLGAERLRSRGDAVSLDAAGLEVDALAFEALADRDPAHAVALLRGEFLEGLILDEAPAFEDWATSERKRYRTRAAAAFVAHGENRLAECRFADATEAAQRAIALDPYTERAVRLSMRAAALRGDVASALAVYHAFCDSLEAGIGEKPSRELVALSERIRQQPAREAPTELDAEPPLVGRESVHREVFQLLVAGLTDGPRGLMITGVRGMGRTRLLAECVRRLALGGATVAVARPLQSDHDAAWSTLRLLLRAGVHHAPGLVGADADALGVFAWLVPELAERSPVREPRDAAHVATALGAVLSAVAEEKPVALCLDDAHLSDAATLDTLLAGVGRLRARRVILVLTAAEDALPSPPALLRLRGEIGRQLRGTSVRLDSLSEGDVRQLVAALAPWCKDDAERDRLTRRLAFEAGGNPFFAITLLEGLRRLSTLRPDFVGWPRPQATLDAPLPFSVPNLVRLAIMARVAELDAESQRVLSAASIGGLALDLDLIAALTALSRSGVEDRLTASERSHLLAFDGERYAFVAPLIAEVVRTECLTPGQRKALRVRAVGALAGRPDLEGRILRAELSAAAEPGQAAFDEAVVLVRAALAAGTTRTARRALAAAERASAPDAELQRPVLDALRAQITTQGG
jgi:DNA-binding SARP family transcriptional activator